MCPSMASNSAVVELVNRVAIFSVLHYSNSGQIGEIGLLSVWKLSCIWLSSALLGLWSAGGNRVAVESE